MAGSTSDRIIQLPSERQTCAFRVTYTGMCLPGYFIGDVLFIVFLFSSGFYHHTHWLEVDCYGEANLSSYNATFSKETCHCLCTFTT